MLQCTKFNYNYACNLESVLMDFPQTSCGKGDHLCSECTRIPLRRCENLNFLGETPLLDLWQAYNYITCHSYVYIDSISPPHSKITSYITEFELLYWWTFRLVSKII